jgi:hypothetical protein
MKVVKWIAILAAIVVLGIVCYSMFLTPILQRGWQG